MIISRNFRFHFRKTCIGIAALLLICTIGIVLFFVTSPANADRESLSKPITQSPEELTTAILAEFASQNKEDALAIDYYITLAKQTKDPDVAKRAVTLALEANQIDLAIAPAQLWANLSPDNLEAQQTISSLLLSQNRLVSAGPYLEKVLQLSHSGIVVSKYAENLSNAINAQSYPLDSLLQSLAAKYANDPKILFYLSIFAGQLGNLKTGLALVEQVLQKTPTDPEAIGWKAQLIFKNGDRAGALDYLKNTIAKSHESSLELLYAELLINDKQFTPAKKLLLSLSTELKVNPDVWLYLVQIARQEQDNVAAINNLKNLEASSDSPDVAREMLGELYSEIKQPAEAINWFQKVGEGPYLFTAKMKAADLMAKQGNPTDALRTLDELTPDTYVEAKQLFLLQAEIMLQNNTPQNALQTLNKGLKLIPNDIQMLYFHALSAQQLDEYDVVESDLKQILSQDPNQVNALNILGFILTNHTTRYQEALTYINKALNIEPENPSILDSMGWVQFRLGNTDKALYYLRAAYSKKSANEIGVHLAEVLWKSGDRNAAEAIFKKMLSSTPNNPDLNNEIKRIKEATP